MVIMEEKGQLSAEYILFLGFVLVIVLALAYYVSDQSEQNTIATATRLGAENASTKIGIMNLSTTPIRVEMINMTTGNNINITIVLSNANLSSEQKQIILTGVQQSVEAQGYTVNNAVDKLTLSTSRHNYTIRLA